MSHDDGEKKGLQYASPKRRSKMASGHNDDGVFEWDPEDKRLREDGMGAEGQRLNPGDILESGEEWYVGWPEARVDEGA